MVILCDCALLKDGYVVNKKEIVIIITISRLEVTPTGFKPVTF